MEETEELTIKKQSKIFIPNENIYKTHIIRRKRRSKSCICILCRTSFP